MMIKEMKKILDKSVFIKGLQYIKAIYAKWELDITNPAVLDAWYRKLNCLNNNQFRMVVENYTDNCKYPPNSPAELLEEVKKVYYKVEMTPDEAWNYVYELISTNSMNYHPEVIYEKLEAFPNVLETVKEMHYKLMNFTSSEASLVAKQFKTSYETKLNKYVETKTTKLIGGNNQKLLGE